MNWNRHVCCTMVLMGTLAASVGFGQNPGDSSHIPRLRFQTITGDWPKIQGELPDAAGAATNVYVLESSADLRTWHPLATLLRMPFAYPDAHATGKSQCFYRVAVLPKGPTNDWANQINVPSDPFFSASAYAAAQRVSWVKFLILLDEPERVYFQDSQAFPLHYDFASRRIPAFIGMSPEAFDAVSLRRQGQRAVLGTVLAPTSGGFVILPGDPADPGVSNPGLGEYGIQFIGQDPYPPELVAQLFRNVTAGLMAASNAVAFYMPAYEQAAAASQYQDYLTQNGILLGTPERWMAKVSTCYAPGWAVGRLVFVTVGEIDAAYGDGRLGPQDILITDMIPAEIPYVSGIISLSPAVPSSHVAILAQNDGIPFVYLPDPAEQQRVRALAGHIVALRVSTTSEDSSFVVDLGIAWGEPLRSQVAALKSPPMFSLVAKEPYGSWSAPVQALYPRDLPYFGGKAANYGLLRRVVPDYAPEAIAFSFDLWDAFMDQQMPGGATLRSVIQSRLSGYSYPPNMASLRTALAGIRDLIRHSTQFTAEQRQSIIAALSIFDPSKKIRFRSSTNVEDSESFTGAGLYDSYSGCLADDLDQDEQGPCACDVTEPEERGVFRAIQRVFASFYNENAFLERLRMGLNENQVGMALLVHHSTPDDTEMANGVATVTAYPSASGLKLMGKLVLQVGAASITNPDINARAEEVGLSVSSGGSSGYTNLTPKAGSALVPIGVQVMNWPSDYQELAGLLTRIVQGYRDMLTLSNTFQLDIEFKKIKPGHLLIKQVRELPMPQGATNLPVLLVSKPAEYLAETGNQTFAGGVLLAKDVYALHRLKSRWHLAPTIVLVNATNLTNCVFPEARVEYREGNQVRNLAGSPGQWPGASHTVTNDPGTVLLDRWTLGEEAERRDYTLHTSLPEHTTTRERQLLTLAEAALSLHVRYASPVPAPGTNGSTAWRTEEAVDLFPVGTSITNVFLLPTNGQWRTLTTNLLRIETTLGSVGAVLGQPPTGSGGPGGIYPDKRPYRYTGTAGETRIEGLVGQPLLLRSFYSQTYSIYGRMSHDHNEDLILDPWLEPELPGSTQAELIAANIRLIHLHTYQFGGPPQETITILGLDNVFRTLTRPSSENKSSNTAYDPKHLFNQIAPQSPAHPK